MDWLCCCYDEYLRFMSPEDRRVYAVILMENTNFVQKFSNSELKLLRFHFIVENK